MKKKTKYHVYTDEQKQYVKDNINGHSYKELTAMFNKEFKLKLTCGQITGLIGHLNLHNLRDRQILGFKRADIGSELTDGNGFIRIKVKDPDVWEYKHKVVWEAVNGPVPEGYCLIFADKNKENCSFDNLILVSAKQCGVMIAKKLYHSDNELTRTGALIAELHLKTKKIKRNMKGGNFRED